MGYIFHSLYTFFTSYNDTIKTLFNERRNIMLENKKVGATGIHYSRYIASWINCGNKYGFEDWLKSMPEITESERRDMVQMWMTGKLELESSVRRFLKKRKQKF
jgi:hypothetical protein